MTIRLNLACGPNVFEDWTNIDRDDVEETYLRHLRGLELSQMHGWPAEQVKLSEAITAGRIQFFCWDLRKGLPMYPAGSIDAIYCGQMIEHLNPLHEVPAFLAECHRVLKPGGCIRLTTPDLGQLLTDYHHSALGDSLEVYAKEQPAYYSGALPEDQLAYIMYGAGGTLEKYEGHQHLYTERSLGKRLEAAGFCRIGPRASWENPPGPFADCLDKGMSHSFALEGMK